ncbi:MAG: IPT/TIG domain-containing protein [Desulfuromonadales bacterium]
MKRLLFLTLLLLACSLTVSVLQAADRPERVKAQTVPAPAAPAAVAAPSILSIIPAQGEPGSKVTIFGSALGEQASAFLGSVEITARVTDGKQLEFVIPKLEPGLYALYIKRGDGTAGRVYNFNILALKPILTSLTPDNVSTCDQGAGREVSANGKNFGETSTLLFDGAVISSRVVSPEQILFNVPHVVGGLHQITVRNDRENGSLPLALMIETRPEISQVSIGSEYVNYYELNIYGKNFQQNSTIYVDGQRIGGRGGQESGEREKLIFLDCTRLVYQRYPYSSTNKDFRIQVVGQGGEGSQVVNVTAP